MNQRYGAWAQLLVLFRLFHDGAEADGLHLPPRHGDLFNPDRFPFLEGRRAGGARQLHERVEPPLVPDGTVYRALDKLLVLEGERISYRALDVEQIGSVYETMMGFRLETAPGRSAAIKAQKKDGAPTTVDLDALIALPSGQRPKSLRARTDRALTGAVRRQVAEAATVADLHAALQPVIDTAATPDLVPAGSLVLQPSEARRRSGSHYTPRALTEPIVRTTLEPILERLRGPDGEAPTPDAILNLRICDPAMGSGAFLVEACRRLGDALTESWQAHGAERDAPSGDDAVTAARRRIAQRCLYGVDRNPMAVDLAKVSLWLVTLAKEEPLTFVDHALRDGDSLVGLSARQIEAVHWDSTRPPLLKGLGLRRILETYTDLRRRIQEADTRVPYWQLRDYWREARAALADVRPFADLALTAFFQGRTPKEREARRSEYVHAFLEGQVEHPNAPLDCGRHNGLRVVPFHWELAFPEVFDRTNPGFDAIIGNPPFQGGRNVTSVWGDVYAAWLRALHDGSSGGADLVAHFFRRSFDLLRNQGVLGLIATNTIAQGDTRASGLRWICTHGGEIFSVRRRVAWPGQAAVIVSVVHLGKGRVTSRKAIDGRAVRVITAFLFHRGGHNDPVRLPTNAHLSFQGSIVLGMGFTFDDGDKKGIASPLAEMHRLIAQDPRNQEVIFPYLGGQEVNASPTHAHHRYVIDFGERPESECRRRWPQLMDILEGRVRPEREKKDAKKYPRMVHEWWKHWNARPELRFAVKGLDRVLVVSRVGHRAAFCFVPTAMVYADSLVVFPVASYAAFCVLQSRVHELWVRFFGSTMKDDLRYTPSDCFATFPLPDRWDRLASLESAGREYYEYRADLMLRRGQGLTATYNELHAPDVQSATVEELRALHSKMDQAVLEAFGWKGIKAKCDFALEYGPAEEGDGKGRWAYRWRDEIRDEVLARLVDRNGEGRRS